MRVASILLGCLLEAVVLMAVADTATFNACVVDDEYGQPLKDVLVEASFSNDNGWKAWTESAPIFRDRMKTDLDGFCRPTAVLRCGSRMKVVPPNVLNEPYGDSDPGRCYYFRVRARHDAQGRLVSCHYGKIYGDFKIGCWLREGGCSVEFLYYLNPVSLDRNLEWDRKNNLCPDPGRLGERRP